MNYAVSAFLMGVNCKYNGGNNENAKIIAFLKDRPHLTVCPEIAGGLPVPRACCEIVNGRILNTDKEDVTDAFIRGAEKEVQRLLDEKVDLVILQPRSPSCGKGRIYDGTFQGKLKDGDGVFVQLCKKQGIEVWNCDEFLEKRIGFLK